MNIDDGRVVSNFIAQALRGEALTVQKPGTQTRSFCYVSDMVDGLIRLMEGDDTGPINIGNPGTPKKKTLWRIVSISLFRLLSESPCLFLR